MVAHRQIGLGQPGLTDGLQHQEGQLVDCILAVQGLSADSHILIHGAACAGEGVGLRTDLIDGQCLDPQIGQQLHRLILGDAALLQIGGQIGVHILVKAAIGQGVTVGFNLQDQLNKPGGLHRLVEGLRRLVRNFLADSGNFQQLGLSGLCCGYCLFTGKGGIAAGEVLHGIDDDQHSLVELILGDGFRLSQIQILFVFPGAALKVLQTQLQHIGIVHDDVCIACVQLAFHSEEAGVHIDLHLFGNQHLATGTEVVVLPEGGNGAQLLFGFFGDVEYIAVPLLEQVQLIHNEFQSVLRENRSILVRGCLVAHQNSFILDIDGHFLKDVLQHQRPLHDRALMYIGLVAFRCQQRTLGIDIRLFIQDTFPEGLHPGC